LLSFGSGLVGAARLQDDVHDADLSAKQSDFLVELVVVGFKAHRAFRLSAAQLRV
jgi:hypothetical protein